MKTKRKSPAKLAAEVEWFNLANPVGSPVRYWPGVRHESIEGIKSTTRSAAWVMGGHSAVVMVEGYAGGIALTHVEPLE